MSLSHEQKTRYFGTIFLKEVGERGQEILLNSKIAVIGCGGLASAALIYLVNSGVGMVTIIDDDCVSYTNLPRQTLFNKFDVGDYKVDVAKDKLKVINYDTVVLPFKERLTKDNAKKLLTGHDIVLDCTDNFESKFLINDVCMELGIPFVIAGVNDFQGQVSTCIPGKSKDFKSLFSTLPIDIDPKYIYEDQGVFPFAVGVVGDLAGSEVIKYLLNIGELLTDKMAVINLLNNQFKIIKFPEQ